MSTDPHILRFQQASKTLSEKCSYVERLWERLLLSSISVGFLGSFLDSDRLNITSSGNHRDHFIMAGVVVCSAAIGVYLGIRNGTELREVSDQFCANSLHTKTLDSSAAHKVLAAPNHNAAFGEKNASEIDQQVDALGKDMAKLGLFYGAFQPIVIHYFFDLLGQQERMHHPSTLTMAVTQIALAGTLYFFGRKLPKECIAKISSDGPGAFYYPKPIDTAKEKTKGPHF